jgi:hypothetical protein
MFFGHSYKIFIINAMGLVGSLSTLLCCALPALLISLGLGSVLASLITTVPWLIDLSKYKLWTFGISGVLLIIASIVRFMIRNASCPTDKSQAEFCTTLRGINKWLYWFCVAIWIIGFFFAFIAVHIFY